MSGLGGGWGRVNEGGGGSNGEEADDRNDGGDHRLQIGGVTGGELPRPRQRVTAATHLVGLAEDTDSVRRRRRDAAHESPEPLEDRGVVLAGDTGEEEHHSVGLGDSVAGRVVGGEEILGGPGVPLVCRGETGCVDDRHVPEGGVGEPDVQGGDLLGWAAEALGQKGVGAEGDLLRRPLPGHDPDPLGVPVPVPGHDLRALADARGGDLLVQERVHQGGLARLHAPGDGHTERLGEAASHRGDGLERRSRPETAADAVTETLDAFAERVSHGGILPARRPLGPIAAVTNAPGPCRASRGTL